VRQDENQALISVIVSTYNRPDALQAVLLALMQQTDRHYEIIVADDGSGQATRDTINRLSPLASRLNLP
jgi:glycosyltransferase involved in cell wall biosynthesis